MHNWFDKFPGGKVLGNQHVALFCAHLLKPGGLNLFDANTGDKPRWTTLRSVQALCTFHRLANLLLIALAIIKCIHRLHERKTVIMILALEIFWLPVTPAISS